LQFGSGFFLHAENDVVCTSNANSGVTFANGFKSILYLEEMTIRRENCDSSIIPRHFDILLISFDFNKLFDVRVKNFNKPLGMDVGVKIEK
jgi:hypothetical protein